MTNKNQNRIGMIFIIVMGIIGVKPAFATDIWAEYVDIAMLYWLAVQKGWSYLWMSCCG